MFDFLPLAKWQFRRYGLSQLKQINRKVPVMYALIAIATVVLLFAILNLIDFRRLD